MIPSTFDFRASYLVVKLRRMLNLHNLLTSWYKYTSIIYQKSFNIVIQFWVSISSDSIHFSWVFWISPPTILLKNKWMEMCLTSLTKHCQIILEQQPPKRSNEGQYSCQMRTHASNAVVWSFVTSDANQYTTEVLPSQQI